MWKIPSFFWLEKNAQFTLAEKPQMNMHRLKKQKHWYLILDHKGTVVNLALLSLYEGSLEITLTVLSHPTVYSPNSVYKTIPQSKVIMQGKLFMRFTHLLYCSVLSLNCNVNKRRMSKPDMRSIFHIKNQWNNLVIGN